jgi:integrase
MTDRLTNLIERLAAKRVGSSWMARCPAHNDHNPSLSIREIDRKICPKPRSHAPSPRKEKKSDRISYLTAEELEALLRAVRAGGDGLAMSRSSRWQRAGAWRRGEVGLLLTEHLRLPVKRAWIERLKGGISHEHTLPGAGSARAEGLAARAWIRRVSKF